MRTRRQKHLVTWLLFFGVLLALVSTTSVHADDPNQLWHNTFSTSGGYTPHGIGCDPDYMGGLCVVAAGSQVTAYWSENYAGHQAGASLSYPFNEPWHTPGHSYVVTSSPVELRLGGPYVFASGGDGFLYKIDAVAGTTAASVDTRQQSCNTDTLKAKAVVQFHDKSNTDFQNGVGDDLVFVITATGCADITHNRVIAYYASNLAVAWIFNAGGAYQVDTGLSACTVDYVRNLLYCATAVAMNSGQNSLWAIDTITGALKWAGNVGYVDLSPKISDDGKRLYVVRGGPDQIGTIYAMNIDPMEACGPQGISQGNSDECWNLSLGNFPIQLDFAVGFWPNDPAGKSRTWIFAVNSQGQLIVVTDDGNTGEAIYFGSASPCGDCGSVRLVTAPVFVPSWGTMYAGDSLGEVLRFEPAFDRLHATYHISKPGWATAPSLDVLLDRTSLASPDAPDRLMVTWVGSVARYSIPWHLEFSSSSGTTTGGSATTVTSTMTDPTTSITTTYNTTQLSTFTQQNSTMFTTTQTYSGFLTATGTAAGGGASTTLTTTITGPVTLTATTTGESVSVTCIMSTSCYTLTFTGNQTITLTTEESSTLTLTQSTVESSTGTYTSTVQTFGTSTLTISNSTGFVYTSTITSPVTLTFASASTTTFTSTLGPNTRNLESFTASNTASNTAPPPPGPQCVIATAAYGSELAPPVQFLRNFRDKQVQRTYLGSRFLSAFNAWYYSWAPSIAKQESGNSMMRAGARVVILPLLGALFVAEHVFTGLAGVNSELAMVVAGFAASTLIGAAYLTPLAYVLKRFARRRFSRRTFIYAAVFAAALALLGTLMHGTTGIAENLTAIFVLECVILSPLTLTGKLLD